MYFNTSAFKSNQIIIVIVIDPPASLHVLHVIDIRSLWLSATCFDLPSSFVVVIVVDVVVFVIVILIIKVYPTAHYLNMFFHPVHAIYCCAQGLMAPFAVFFVVWR